MRTHYDICLLLTSCYREVAYREVKNAHRATQGLPPLPEEPTAVTTADSSTAGSSSSSSVDSAAAATGDAAANAEVKIRTITTTAIDTSCQL
jgi:hypothetical protein